MERENSSDSWILSISIMLGKVAQFSRVHKGSKIPFRKALSGFSMQESKLNNS